MFDRSFFFQSIRPLFGSLSQDQVDGLNHLLDAWEADYSDYPRAYLAYALATAYHETAKRMQPIEEFGKGKGRRYGTPVNGHVYFGRGYVQLTWDYNYKKAGQKLGLDLLNKPELALDPIVSAKIMFTEMIEGWFTGKSLKLYFDGKSDPVNARRIINGTDRATLIAGYHAKFMAALRDAPTTTAAATVEKPKSSTGILGAILKLFRKA